jgi:hypothetical protein
MEIMITTNSNVIPTKSVLLLSLRFAAAVVDDVSIVVDFLMSAGYVKWLSSSAATTVVAASLLLPPDLVLLLLLALIDRSLDFFLPLPPLALTRGGGGVDADEDVDDNIGVFKPLCLAGLEELLGDRGISYLTTAYRRYVRVR